MLEIDDLIHHARELEPLPASAVRLATLAGSSNSDLAEVSEIIAFDQALTMRLLRAANSAAAASSTRIVRTHDAVVRLGTARVLALTLAAGVTKILHSGVPAYGLSEGQLWRHSVAAAAAAESLPEFALNDVPTESFAAALLHDIGKLVMGRYLSPEDLEWIHRAQLEGGRNALDAEREVLDVHHGELGGIVAQHWQLPESIVRGIIYHHNPADGLDTLCDAVYLSNIVAKHIEGLPSPAMDPDSIERMGLSEARAAEWVEAAKKRFATVSARYNAV